MWENIYKFYTIRKNFQNVAIEAEEELNDDDKGVGKIHYRNAKTKGLWKWQQISGTTQGDGRRWIKKWLNWLTRYTSIWADISQNVSRCNDDRIIQRKIKQWNAVTIERLVWLTRYTSIWADISQNVSRCNDDRKNQAMECSDHRKISLINKIYEYMSGY